MGRPAYQDSWRAEEELAVPEFLIKAANGTAKTSLIWTCLFQIYR